MHIDQSATAALYSGCEEVLLLKKKVFKKMWNATKRA